MVQFWNPSLKEQSKFIILPVSLHDEIKTDGYGMALIQYLTRIGILREVPSPKRNVPPSWERGPQWNKKWAVMCLDGLSLDRHRSFCRKLINLPISFRRAYQQASIFKDALSRVIEISGPLHMSFHMLQSIYILYKPLLLTAQKVLHWRHLNMSKVSECFRLSESLCFILYEEIFRMIFFEFLEEECGNTPPGIEEDESVFCIKLITKFMRYIDNRIDRSKDYRKLYIYNFIKLVILYKQYRESVHAGDAPAMEHFESEFVVIFYLLDKHKYVEIILSSIERRYHFLPFDVLQMVRQNSSCRYKKDVNREEEYVVHALDELIENVNMWTKRLPLGSSQESWVKHSPNVMMARQSQLYEEHHYRKSRKRMKDNRYVEPRKVVEKQRIFEFVTKYFDGEEEGRTFNMKSANEVVENLTTKLKHPSKKTNISEDMHLEKCVYNINLLSSVKNLPDKQDICDSLQDGDGVAGNNEEGSDTEYDDNNAQDPSDDDDSLFNDFEDIPNEVAEEDYDENDNESIAQSIIEETQIPSIDDEEADCDDDENVDVEPPTRMNQIGDVHRLSVIDIISFGKKELKKKDITKVRLRRKERLQRNDTFLTTLYENMVQSRNEMTTKLLAIKNNCDEETDNEDDSRLLSQPNLPDYTNMYRNNIM